MFTDKDQIEPKIRSKLTKKLYLIQNLNHLPGYIKANPKVEPDPVVIWPEVLKGTLNALTSVCRLSFEQIGNILENIGPYVYPFSKQSYT